MEKVKIGLVSVSDRAYNGVYVDQGLPALKLWLTSALKNPFECIEVLIPDEQDLIEQKLIELVDQQGCDLILTTGGTGPYPRDVTPDATLNIADRVMPGFGEQMRQVSLHFVPTAILSRQLGGDSKKLFDSQFAGSSKGHCRNLSWGKRPCWERGGTWYFCCRAAVY